MPPLLPPTGIPTVPAPHGAAGTPAPAAGAAPAGRAVYWANLVLLAAVAAGTSFWFRQHLVAYLDQVILLGGGVSLWAVLRMAWSVFEKSSRTDPWDVSRRLLSSAEASRLLVAAATVLLVLWFTTGSQYFEYDGPAVRQPTYTVHIVRDDPVNRGRPPSERQSFVADAVLTPQQRVKGGVFYWTTRAIPLKCVLEKEGVPYAPRDCSIRPGASVRTKVPGDFELKKVQLLRIVPAVDLFGMLPGKDAAVDSVAYRLKLRVGDREQVLVEDLRQGVVYIGARREEMDELRGMVPDSELKPQIRDAYLAMRVSPESADKSIPVLLANQQWLPGHVLEKGQQLRIVLERLTLDNGRETTRETVGRPVEHRVGDERVHTIWLSTKS